MQPLSSFSRAVERQKEKNVIDGSNQKTLNLHLKSGGKRARIRNRGMLLASSRKNRETLRIPLEVLGSCRASSFFLCSYQTRKDWGHPVLGVISHWKRRPLSCLRSNSRSEAREASELPLAALEDCGLSIRGEEVEERTNECSCNESSGFSQRGEGTGKASSIGWGVKKLGPFPCRDGMKILGGCRIRFFT